MKAEERRDCGARGGGVEEVAKRRNPYRHFVASLYYVSIMAHARADF